MRCRSSPRSCIFQVVSQGIPLSSIPLSELVNFRSNQKIFYTLFISTFSPNPTILLSILAKCKRFTFWSNYTRGTSDMRTPSTAEEVFKVKMETRRINWELRVLHGDGPQVPCAVMLSELWQPDYTSPSSTRQKSVLLSGHTNRLKRKDLKCTDI